MGQLGVGLALYSLCWISARQAVASGSQGREIGGVLDNPVSRTVWQRTDQLNAPQTKAYAKHCFEGKTAEELRAATHETPDPEVLSARELTEGQYAEAVTTALGDLE